jgi:hypothetical protein
MADASIIRDRIKDRMCWNEIRLCPADGTGLSEKDQQFAICVRNASGSEFRTE